LDLEARKWDTCGEVLAVVREAEASDAEEEEEGTLLVLDQSVEGMLWATSEVH
jgi:hypothetical protein